ncbi:MAG: nitroreductase family protein [Candidatus Lokiarchaeota archaeon]|nr:nitroreductase family protein [Candidatus Lokiarchaeota archaeon]
MDAIECLKTRRSVRSFTKEPVSKAVIEEILECGRWAPSGLNHQPWHVLVITNEAMKQQLATCTTYGHILLSAPCTLAIFLDTTKKYSYVKNVQGIGALFENLLLAIHALGLGGVWLGQIYENKAKVHAVLGITDPSWEFMGAIAFGHPAGQGSSDRKDLASFTRFVE